MVQLESMLGAQRLTQRTSSWKTFKSWIQWNLSGYSFISDLFNGMTKESEWRGVQSIWFVKWSQCRTTFHFFWMFIGESNWRGSPLGYLFISRQLSGKIDLNRLLPLLWGCRSLSGKSCIRHCGAEWSLCFEMKFCCLRGLLNSLVVVAKICQSYPITLNACRHPLFGALT